MGWLNTILQAFAKPFQWWVVVAPWERGLRVRLGKVAADLAPGIHLRIPFLDRILLQSIRLRTVFMSGLTVTTADGHPIIVSIAIDFAITDLRQMFDSLSAPDVTLRYRAAAAVADYLSRKCKAEISALGIERAANEAMDQFGCGLGLIRVRVTMFSYARTHRIIMNDYSDGAGLFHGFDAEPTSGPR